MSATYEDRLLDLLLDEVTSPSLPTEEPLADEPAERPRRVRKRYALVVSGIAAAAALVAGVLAFGDDDLTPVRTKPDVAAAAPLDVPYFTIGQPVGSLSRSTPIALPDQRMTFRSADEPDWTVQIGPGLTADMPGLADAGTVDGRHLSTLALADSGGKPFGVYFWTEPDGSRWSISATDRAASVEGRESDDTAARRLVDDALDGLRIEDGVPKPPKPFEPFLSLDQAPALWSVQDGRSFVSAIDDSTTAVADIPGTDATVKGKPAKVRGRDLYWRETADVLINVKGIARGRRVDDLSDALTPALLLQIADQLVVTDRSGYESIHVDRGADPERMVIVLPDGASGPVQLFTERIADPAATLGQGSGSYGGWLGPDGVSLDIADGSIGFYVWSGLPRTTFSQGLDNHPACAQRVMVPPAGSPAAVVTLDTTCAG